MYVFWQCLCLLVWSVTFQMCSYGVLCLRQRVDLFYDLYCVLCLEIFSLTELRKSLGWQPCQIVQTYKNHLSWLSKKILLYTVLAIIVSIVKSKKTVKWIETLQEHVLLWNLLSPVLILSSTIIGDSHLSSVPYFNSVYDKPKRILTKLISKHCGH
jgi:hypothetical protein